MRSVLHIVLFACAVAPGFASDRSVTVILDFDSVHPSAVTNAMQQEAARLLSDLDYNAEWRSRNSVGSAESFERVAMLRFHGACTALEPSRQRLRTKRPLGYAHVQDGAVLPFADIDCSLIQSYIGDDIARGSVAAREQAYGRALGRVVAHELEHMLSRTTGHESSGLMHESFSPSDLAGTAAFEAVR